MVLTANGKILMARQLAGEVFTFTNVKIGDGTLSAGQTEATMTALKNILKTVPFSSIERTKSNQVSLKITYSNEGFDTEKSVREMGIFAKIGNEAEVLYAYENKGAKPDVMPAYSTETFVRRVSTLDIIVSESGTAQVIIDPTIVFPTREEIQTEVSNLLEGNRNLLLTGGGELKWGVTANVFAWSKQINIFAGTGRLLYGGLNFKEINIAPGNVTLPNAWDCAYITLPDAYADITNKKATVTLNVGQANAVTGTDKLILFIRDSDSCLELFTGGWIPYGTTVQVGGKRDTYIDKSIFTAVNDFVLGTGVGAYVKKTLAEVKSILGINNLDNTSDANKPVSTAQQTALNGKVDKSSYTASGDVLVGTGAGAFVKKTMAELKTLLLLVKGDVGLGSVDNTSDANKPVSTAQQTALENAFQGNRNINLPGGGELKWGVTANVFSWSKEMRILPAGGKLLPGGTALTNIKIALGSVTLANAWDCMYITIPTTDGATVVPAVAQYNAITGDDKLILAVRDTDSCLELFAGGWLVYGTTVAVGGKRDNYLDKTIFTALNDFVVGTGAGTYAKKTLAEAKTILGINSATTGATGVIQLATSAEVTTGTDVVKAVTPSTLKVELDKKIDDAQLSIDGAMTSNSDTLIPSQKAVKYYVDQNIANIVNSAPALLNTLDELAASLGDDANFATTMTNALANKIDKSIFTAVNDFVLGNGVGTYVKKTLAEVRTLLQDASNRFVADTEKATWNGKLDKSLFTASNDFLVGAGASSAIKKTPSEVRTILNVEDGATKEPIGAIAFIPHTSLPNGWLKANGAAISRTTYSNLFALIGTTFGAGDGSTTFNLPDLRGEFIRGWDDGRGVDTGRTLGSWQTDMLKSHSHTGGAVYTGLSASGPGGYGGYLNASDTGLTGGTETRPRNIALLAIIKF